MDPSKTAESSFFEEHEDETKALAKSLGEQKSDAIAGAAAALLVKVLLAQLPLAGLAAPTAEMLAAVVGKRFGEWFADNPTARLQAAHAAHKKQLADRAQLVAFAAIVEPIVTQAVELVLERGIESCQQENFDVIADGMCKTLDVLTSIQADVKQLLAQATGASAAIALNWKEAWNFAPYIEEKRRGFIGREWLFEKLQTWITNQSETSAQAMLIVGDFGVGKSAVMAELASRTRGLPIVAAHFCQRDTQETLRPASFVRNLVVQLNQHLLGFKAALAADQEALERLQLANHDALSAFELGVLGPLHAMKPPEHSHVVLVDGLDEALDFAPAAAHSVTLIDLLASRAERMPRWLKWLVTTRRRYDVLQPLSHAFRFDVFDAEDAVNLNDIRRFAQAHCAQGELATLLDPDTARAIIERLADPAVGGGNFLYAARVLRDLANGKLTPGDVAALPPGMDAFYRDAFDRRFRDALAFEPVRPLLAFMCVAREPMARSELAELLEMTEARVSELLRPLEDFLTITHRHYTFDHASLWQWLTQEDQDGNARAGRFAIDLPGAVTQMILCIARARLKAQGCYDTIRQSVSMSVSAESMIRRAVNLGLLPNMRQLRTIADVRPGERDVTEGNLRWAIEKARLLGIPGRSLINKQKEEESAAIGCDPRDRFMARALDQGGTLRTTRPPTRSST